MRREDSTFTGYDGIFPPELCMVKDIYNAKSDRMIIHIQDAHCNYNAQQSISRIIEHLTSGFGIDVVNLEGGNGGYDLSLFRSVLDREIREGVSDYFLREGIISGAEYFVINNEEKVMLWGLEDVELYLKNLEAYRDSINYKNDMLEGLNRLRWAFDRIKNDIYSEDLLYFDNLISQYESGEIEFKEFLKQIVDLAMKKNIDIDKFKNVLNLYETIKTEEKIDFEEAEIEKKKIVEYLTRKLSVKDLKVLKDMTVSLKIRRIDNLSYYEYLMLKADCTGFGSGPCGDFMEYVDYLRRYDSIDKADVKDEIGSLTEEIKTNLYQYPDQKKLDSIFKDISILNKMFSARLSPDDYRYFNEKRDDFKRDAFFSFLEETSGENVPEEYGRLKEELKDFDENCSKMKYFYKYSFERDRTFLDNIIYQEIDISGMHYSSEDLKVIPLMEPFGESKIAIMISGGFHSDNIKELCEKEKISYVSIVPVFSMRSNVENKYFKLLSGETNVTLDILNTCMSALAIYSHFCGSRLAEGEDGNELALRLWIKLVIAEEMGRKRSDYQTVSESGTEYAFRKGEEEGFSPVDGLVINGEQVYAKRAGDDDGVIPSGDVIERRDISSRERFKRFYEDLALGSIFYFGIDFIMSRIFDMFFEAGKRINKNFHPEDRVGSLVEVGEKSFLVKGRRFRFTRDTRVYPCPVSIGGDDISSLVYGGTVFNVLSYTSQRGAVWLEVNIRYSTGEETGYIKIKPNMIGEMPFEEFTGEDKTAEEVRITTAGDILKEYEKIEEFFLELYGNKYKKIDVIIPPTDLFYKLRGRVNAITHGVTVRGMAVGMTMVPRFRKYLRFGTRGFVRPPVILLNGNVSFIWLSHELTHAVNNVLSEFLWNVFNREYALKKNEQGAFINQVLVFRKLNPRKTFYDYVREQDSFKGYSEAAIDRDALYSEPYILVRVIWEEIDRNGGMPEEGDIRRFRNIILKQVRSRMYRELEELEERKRTGENAGMRKTGPEEPAVRPVERNAEPGPGTDANSSIVSEKIEEALKLAPGMKGVFVSNTPLYEKPYNEHEVKFVFGLGRPTVFEVLSVLAGHNDVWINVRITEAAKSDFFGEKQCSVGEELWFKVDAGPRADLPYDIFPAQAPDDGKKLIGEIHDDSGILLTDGFVFSYDNSDSLKVSHQYMPAVDITFKILGEYDPENLIIACENFLLQAILFDHSGREIDDLENFLKRIRRIKKVVFVGEISSGGLSEGESFRGYLDDDGATLYLDEFFKDRPLSLINEFTGVDLEASSDISFYDPVEWDEVKVSDRERGSNARQNADADLRSGKTVEMESAGGSVSPALSGNAGLDENDKKKGFVRLLLSLVQRNTTDIVVLPVSEVYVAQQVREGRKLARSLKKIHDMETIPLYYNYNTDWQDGLREVLKKALDELEAKIKDGDRTSRVIVSVPRGARAFVGEILMSEDFKGLSERFSVVEIEVPQNSVINIIDHIILGKALLDYERYRKGDYGDGGIGEEEIISITDMIKMIVSNKNIFDFSSDREIISKLLDGMVYLKIEPVDLNEISRWGKAYHEILISL